LTVKRSGGIDRPGALLRLDPFKSRPAGQQLRRLSDTSTTRRTHKGDGAARPRQRAGRQTSLPDDTLALVIKT